MFTIPCHPVHVLEEPHWYLSTALDGCKLKLGNIEGTALHTLSSPLGGAHVIGSSPVAFVELGANLDMK